MLDWCREYIATRRMEISTAIASGSRVENARMALIDDDQVIHAIASDRSNQALNVSEGPPGLRWRPPGPRLVLRHR
jgi:hypothetical protein